MSLSNNDINTFFHMRNHYLKIKNAKSTFIFPNKTAQVKPSCTLSEKHRKMIEFEEKLDNVTYVYVGPKEESTIARVARPSTRRNPEEVPPANQLVKPRVQIDVKIPVPNTAEKKKKTKPNEQKRFTSPSPKENSNSENKKKNTSRPTSKTNFLSARSDTKEKLNSNRSEKSNNSLQSKSSPTSSLKSNKETKESHKNNRVEEHEYLLFLLRVTEDIIMNNYFANEDIERVFREHMDMNANRLAREKMEQHLARLADELHIGDVQPNTKTEIDVVPKSPYTNIQALEPCQCECGPTEVYINPPSEEYNYYNQYYQNNLDEIIYYRHSLGRLTEHTEPTNSSSTLTKVISSTKSENALSDNDLLDDIKLKAHERMSEILNVTKNYSEDSLSQTKQKEKAKNEEFKEVIETSDHKTDSKSKLDTDIDEKIITICSNSIITTNSNVNTSIDNDRIQEINSEVTSNSSNKNSMHELVPSNKNSSTTNIECTEIESVTNIYKNDFHSDKSSSKKIDSESQTNSINDFNITESSDITTEVTRRSSEESTKKFVESIEILTKNDRQDSKELTEQKNIPAISKFNNNIGNKGANVITPNIYINEGIGDYNPIRETSFSDKDIAEKGDFKLDKNVDDSVMKESNVDALIPNFRLEKISTQEVFKCDMRLNLDFPTNSLECLLPPSPFRDDSKSDLFSKTNDNDPNKYHSYTIIPFKPKELDKSVQTSTHKLIEQEKPQMESKYVQIDASYTSTGCCTDDVNVDADVEKDDYVLIMSPVYVLKSALNSKNKIIVKQEVNPIENMELDLGIINNKESDIDLQSESNSSQLKLLGSDYDLTPERDTSDKYQNLLADVSNSLSNLGIPSLPSLTSIPEENLLLGNVYEIQDNSNSEVDLGSLTYRCIDNPKAASCDEDIFLRNSDVLVTRNWQSDRGENDDSSRKKRINKSKYTRTNPKMSSSTSSASLTC